MSRMAWLMCLAETAGLSWDAGAAGCFSFPLSLFLSFLSLSVFLYFHTDSVCLLFIYAFYTVSSDIYIYISPSEKYDLLHHHSDFQKCKHFFSTVFYWKIKSISPASIWRGRYEVINIGKHSSLEAIFGEWIPHKMWWEPCPQSSQILIVWKFVIHR